MPIELTADAFGALLRQPLRLAAAGQLALELVAVTRSPSDSVAHPAFALTLRGPLEPALEQGTYGFELPGGTLDIFIVPSARDAHGMQYQAVFN